MKQILLVGLLACAPVRGELPLADAVQKSDHGRIKSLLTERVDVNTPQVDGMTALHWAAQKDDTETARLLIKAGADAKATNRYGITPLSLACQSGNGVIVEVLLGAGADPNTRQRGGETALMIAARTGKIGSVKALLSSGADVNAKEKRGQTAVMWAAAEGHADVVNLLIESGADFRTPLDGGFTPLFFAIREGRAEVVQRLLAAGVEVNEAMQPKRKAARGPQAGMTPLLIAIENGHFELAIQLVKAGADPNDQRGGYAALHNITWVRKPNHGEDEDGMPPPAGSGNLDSLQFVREIVALGANVNARIPKAPGGLGVLNRTGATPFLLAGKTADSALLKLLYELGADPSITTIDGVTPLIAAAGLGTLAAGEVAGTEEEVLEALEWLVTIGSDVNAVDKNGETAMHAAAYKNLPKVVQFLANHGAKMEVWNTKDKYGWTPLLIAEGFRPGNFKPSFETIAAIHKVMLASGVNPPPLTSAEGVNNSDFGPRERKYISNPETFDASALAESAHKSVVVIRQLGRDGQEYGIGAGFVVAADGLIATCLHVIGEARPITVELADGRRFDVTEIHASDRKLDLAVVRINATKLPRLRLGDSAALKPGTPVVAIGNPVGLRHSVVQGVVSAKRDIDGLELIQLAIPLEPGNSGGPLLDSRGRVQGLLNMKSALTANLGFAVPVNSLQTLLDRPNPVPMARWLTLDALNTAEWKPIMGAQWSRKAGRIQVEGMGEGFGGRSLCLWQKPVPPLPYELSVAVKLEDESGAAGLAFASDSGDQHYGFYPTAGQLRLTRFDGPNVFSWTILKEFKTPLYKPGDWNTIRVRVETNRIAGYVNDELVLESNDTAWRSGAVGLAKFRDTKAQFKDFSVSTNAPDTKGKSISREGLAAAVQSEGLSPKTDEEIITRLQSTGKAGHAALLGRAVNLEKEAQQMRRVASRLHTQFVESELVTALKGPEDRIDLFHAALLVAKLDNAELDIKAYHLELKRLADELKEQLSPDSTEVSQAAALSKFLFTDRGFHGCRIDYYNRANSYINQVIDDREGLPITLAVLYIELARHIGLTSVAGLPLPTHFMVRFQPAGHREQIIDVFDGGKVLTRSQAVELVFDNVERIDENDFQPATKRDIITRMLRNLLGSAERNGNPTDALRYLNVIVALNPESALDRFNRARLEVQAGHKASAKADLRWLLDQKPPGVDLERLEELYRSL